MIDLHCHILPGIDDGPANWEEAIAIARQLVEQDVNGVFATPHYLPGNYPEARQVDLLCDELNHRLRIEQIPIKVYPGAEAYMEPELSKLVSQKKIGTLNHGKYLLMEMPFENIPTYTEEVVFELQLAGITPILAHPERTRGLGHNFERLSVLIDRGLLVQVNIGSILGEFGSEVQRVVNKLVDKGLVHFLGSDAHHPNKRPPQMKRGVAALMDWISPSKLEDITVFNPVALLSGEEITVSTDNADHRSRRRFLWWKNKMPMG